VLDAVLGEDRSRRRTGGAPLALRLVRGAVVTLLRVAGHASITDAQRRLHVRPLEAIALVKRQLARAQRRTSPLRQAAASTIAA